MTRCGRTWDFNAPPCALQCAARVALQTRAAGLFRQRIGSLYHLVCRFNARHTSPTARNASGVEVCQKLERRISLVQAVEGEDHLLSAVGNPQCSPSSVRFGKDMQKVGNVRGVGSCQDDVLPPAELSEAARIRIAPPGEGRGCVPSLAFRQSVGRSGPRPAPAGHRRRAGPRQEASVCQKVGFFLDVRLISVDDLRKLTRCARLCLSQEGSPEARPKSRCFPSLRHVGGHYRDTIMAQHDPRLPIGFLSESSAIIIVSTINEPAGTEPSPAARFFPGNGMCS